MAHGTQTAGSRHGRVGVGGVVLVVVLAAGLGVAGWAVWSTLRGPAPATAGTDTGPTDGTPGTGLADPSAFEVIVRAAREHVREGNPGAAEQVLRGGVKQFAGDQQLRIELAELLVNSGRAAEAYEQMVAALAIGPRTAGLEFHAGTIASAIGENGRAIEHFSAAQTADPADPRYPLYLAAAQVSAGETEAAQANLVRATVLDAGNAIAWGQLAELALRENKSGLAVQHARKARDADPTEPAWRLIESRALKRAGEPEQALGVLLSLDEAVLVRPEFTKAAAEALGMLDRAGEAADLYERSLAARPGDGAVAFEAALWSERAGRAERAIEQARLSQRLGHAPAERLVERLNAGG